LWCYEQVERLQEHGEVVICFDEKPSLQALERCAPTQRLRPGQSERVEFEYQRHGTVNFATALVVHNGQMRGWCLDKNDSAHLRPALAELFAEFKAAKRLHLIWDGGASHTAQATQEFLAAYKRWVRVLVTPPHASWLNQGELWLRAFSERYLKRGDWLSRGHLIRHLEVACHEYNYLVAANFFRPLQGVAKWNRASHPLPTSG
jgi:hypothetical protein